MNQLWGECVWQSIEPVVWHVADSLFYADVPMLLSSSVFVRWWDSVRQRVVENSLNSTCSIETVEMTVCKPDAQTKGFSHTRDTCTYTCVV